MSAISLHTRSSRKSQCTFSFAAAAPQYFSVPPCRTFEVFREGPEADRPPLAVQISPPRGSVGGLAPGWAEGDSKASSRFEGTGNRIQVSGTAGKNSATEPPLHCPDSNRRPSAVDPNMKRSLRVPATDAVYTKILLRTWR
ncbi:uncharacterized protein LOC143688686 isoform X1 [Tamandua tetradactyla]|uniref:uncharacterized protein LOC143688686 isoform X1 n=1 Tax=Tamandua tetradactyla TaxID=48850 RepID=UPI0040541F75